MDYYDLLLAKQLGGGGGGSSVDVEALSVTANGTYTAPTGKAYSPVSVDVQPPQEPEIKDVNFYDYDGTLLYSFTKTEWSSQTALPSNPSHSGLTAQGWNWTKNEIDSQLTNVPDCPVFVGQHYISASGDTEITIELIAPRLSPYLSLAVNGTVEIDWGDGSTKTTLTKTSVANPTNTVHNYSSEGTYVIKVHRVSGSYYLSGTNGSNAKYPVLNSNNATLNYNYIYSSAIKDVKIGDLGSGGGIGVHTFAGVELKSVPIPNNFDSTYSGYGFDTSKFEFVVLPKGFTGLVNNTSVALPDELHTICFPPTTTSMYLQSKSYLRNVTAIYGSVIASNGFRDCAELRVGYTPPNLTSILDGTFRACYSLTKITIPSGVTSIGALAFADCRGLGEMHLKSTTPPTVSNDNALSTIPADCVIYVPTASLSDYQTASIWSNYASRMVGE